jgi:hypothetical protein
MKILTWDADDLEDEVRDEHGTSDIEMEGDRNRNDSVAVDRHAGCHWSMAAMKRARTRSGRQRSHGRWRHDRGVRGGEKGRYCHCRDQ